MDLKISYRHLEPSDSISAKIEEKVKHLKKYFQGKLNIDWVCSVEGHQQHKSEVNVTFGGMSFHAHAVDKNLYASLDLVIQKLEKQIQKKNEKLKNHIHKNIDHQVNYSEDL